MRASHINLQSQSALSTCSNRDPNSSQFCSSPEGLSELHRHLTSQPASGSQHYSRPDAFASIGIASLKSQTLESKPTKRGWELLSALPSSAQVADTAKHLLSGGMSAVVARSCVAPFERVKLEMVLHQRQAEGTWRVAWSVLQHEGVRGLWKGNVLNLLRTAPHKVKHLPLPPPPPSSPFPHTHTHTHTHTLAHTHTYTQTPTPTPDPHAPPVLLI